MAGKFSELRSRMSPEAQARGALGGELKLVASFPEGDIALNLMLSEP